MHDVCFTIPYELILVVGGLIGYFKKRSVASLGGGVETGLLLILTGFLSRKAFERRKKLLSCFNYRNCLCSCSDICHGETIYGNLKDHAMPAGVIAGISALVTGFYLYKIATGGNHIPAKPE